MKLLLSIFILLPMSMPFGWQAAAEAVTRFPLGENAFPREAQCLDAAGCGSEDYWVRDFSDPLMRPVTAAEALLGYRLRLVAIDLDGLDVIQLVFPKPIMNQDGDDIYLGQASFLGDLADTPGTNGVEIRFGESVTWHTVDRMQFLADTSVTPIVTHSDPEIKQEAYALWYAGVDLSDFGFPPDVGIKEIFIRGVINEGGSGLDLAVVGNLNQPACPGDFKKEGSVDGVDLALFTGSFGRTDCLATYPPCAGDFGGDGDVDITDLEWFAADFGRADCN